MNGFAANAGEPLAAAAKESTQRDPRSYTPKHLAEKILTSRSALRASARQVTALFADIKGSMELIEDLDPEEARAIIDPALQLMIDAVHRYEGYVAQSTGDGIFALFGAPIAHEDHSQRALHAALRMQEEIRRYADEAASREGCGPSRSASASTPEKSSYARSGRTTSTPTTCRSGTRPAWRRGCRRGTTGVDCSHRAVRRLCEGYFSFRSLGVTDVKGVHGSVEVFEVTGLGPLRTRFQHAASLGLTKFVGREAELAQVNRALELAKTGHGQIVAVIARARRRKVAAVPRVQGRTCSLRMQAA